MHATSCLTLLYTCTGVFNSFSVYSYPDQSPQCAVRIPGLIHRLVVKCYFRIWQNELGFNSRENRRRFAAPALLFFQPENSENCVGLQDIVSKRLFYITQYSTFASFYSRYNMISLSMNHDNRGNDSSLFPPLMHGVKRACWQVKSTLKV